MKTLYFILEKEFRQLLRNRQLMRTLLLAPLIQLILLPLAADYTVKDIQIAVTDNDHSPTSQRLIAKITASGYFRLAGYTASYPQALQMVEQDKADLALQIPAHFERDLVRENSKQLYIAINAIEGTKANLGGAYLQNIISDFNDDVRIQWNVSGVENSQSTPGDSQQITAGDIPQVTVTSSNWYNPLLKFPLYMVPAILVTLVTAMVAMQSAFNIVQEKESGTIEQINVTPIKKHIFIIGKMIPFLVLGIVLFTMGLLVGRILYGIVPLGSLWVLYLSLIVYLFSMLGLGLLLATYSFTQMQAMSLSFFFINIFNMMSGVFTAVDSMPGWAQTIVATFPPSHFIKIMRMVVLKGSGFSDILPKLGAMALIGLFLNTWAVLNYRKTA
ncbi:MAG TPA: ABC transporter permease [Puia sp.]|jgi:ABC-2 type transport system permease protein|nr:ABC transporter permease [Puia sp.]